MRTSFQDWEDKALVQIALLIQKEGIQITWSFVARLMTKSKRTGSELRLRLTSLNPTTSTAQPCMEVVDLVELESVRSDELEKAKAVAGSHAPTTEVVSMVEMFEALLG
ncbi:hypothetical protein PI124_g13739 [Phytophthora idaei]|nr:hypothetical protein PI125_g14048 [Phytophthora idaei]KAG3144036.1 hypothetical protein PI126_g14329 [Phytophthora idaei]KAG3241400.1 hypothetical protein PI124_g13739 [Phytophthora idaei]